MLPILKFKPYYKSVIWGGTRIATFKGVESQGDTIGESWELSPMPGHESIVAEGPYKGRTLNSLVIEFPERLMGENVVAKFGPNFPLLIKFIDSTSDLSIQVHPDDALASKRHNSLGKTEMWYSVQPTSTAYLYAGFSRHITPDDFRRMVAESSIVDALARYDTKPGDVFFLPAGRVHAIGQGNFVLEIQEASDITYRIYDYNRRDADGNLRQLHVDESVEAINYDDLAEKAKNVTVSPGNEVTLEDCRYFTTTLAGVNGSFYLNLESRPSFTILVATKGSLTVVAPDGVGTPLPQGQTLLVPAEMPEIELRGAGEVVTVFIH